MINPPTSTPPDAFTQELQRIRQLIGSGQLQPAALALNQAQQQAPADPRVLLLGMRLAEAAGNPKAALQAAQRAVQMAPDWHVALIELAQLLARQQQGDEAVQLATQALALVPYDVNVVVGAINTAFFAGNQQQTLAWAEQGTRQFPDDAGIRRFLGHYLLSLRQPGDALPHFEYMHQRDAQNTDVLDSLVDCARQLGDGERMRRYADLLIGLLPASASARYWHAVAHGQTPPTQPPELVARLFDEQAKDFEQRVVGGLQYHLPERVAAIVQALHPERRFNLLDLGCGTGLVGLHLGRIEGHVIGVELSARMIEQAAAHGVYSRIHQVNVLDALRETPAEHYEVITCTDVLIYVGDLAPVAPDALRILKPGGHFIFSCEAAGDDEPDLVLRSASNRYAHKASAVQRLCQAAGFDPVQIEPLPALRLEAGQPVAGFLVTARKPG